MIGFTLLEDHIPLPRILYDALGAAYVEGMTDPEPRRLELPYTEGYPDVPDWLWQGPEDD